MHTRIMRIHAHINVAMYRAQQFLCTIIDVAMFINFMHPKASN